MTVFGSGDPAPTRIERRFPAGESRSVAAEHPFAWLGPALRKRQFYISVSAPKFNEKPQ